MGVETDQAWNALITEINEANDLPRNTIRCFESCG